MRRPTKAGCSVIVYGIEPVLPDGAEPWPTFFMSEADRDAFRKGYLIDVREFEVPLSEFEGEVLGVLLEKRRVTLTDKGEVADV